MRRNWYWRVGSAHLGANSFFVQSRARKFIEQQNFVENLFRFRPALDHAAYFQLTRDIALGMNYLHLHKPSVLHLDLKSMNVLLTQELRAKIADFGFSKFKWVFPLCSRFNHLFGRTVAGWPFWSQCGRPCCHCCNGDPPPPPMVL